MSRQKLAGMQKRSVPKKGDWKALEIVHPDAAGVDVGGSEHWVAISPNRDPEPVRRFGCFTADLREMGRWLVEKGVRCVAMQSTGVYWMPVFEVLEQQGLEVYLVNAQHTKNVPGRKSDIQECQWLLKLHAFGLLNNGCECGATHAESSDGDERATQQCAERHQRPKRHEDHRGHFGRGA